MLLSAAFLPPVEYFAAIAKGISFDGGALAPAMVWMEGCENYQKQSWRNRCLIGAAHGAESITVPVVHQNGTFSLPIREIRVDYSTPWLERALRTLDSAYHSAPFYDHYRDSLFSILESRPSTLWDLDIRLTQWLASKLGLPVEWNVTETFELSPSKEKGEDFRYSLHPKKALPESINYISGRTYYQVFSHKHGFVPGLSAIDLLFGEGPECSAYLFP